MKSPLVLKLGAVSGLFLIVGVIFGWILFPILICFQIGSQVALKPGSEMRALNTKTPFPFDVRIYLFNITNPDAVQNGETPMLDEIGPYFYEEWKEKLNIFDNDADDTMEYNPKTTFTFNQTRSGKLTGDEVIIIPHPIIVGPLVLTAREKPPMLGLLNKAVGVVFNQSSIFLKTTVREILFDGILINCNVTNFAAKGFCQVLRTEAKGLKHITDKHFSFSFFGAKNETIEPRKIKIKRGVQNPKDVGRVVEFGGKDNINVWGGRPCDDFQGTDSTIFPPFLEEEEGLAAFEYSVCRSMRGKFHKNSIYKGIPIREYKFSFGDMSTNEEEKCFCMTPETCLKKGTIDLTKCLGVPVVASLPHFYDSDPMHLEQVRGLRPRVEEHGVPIYFEPITGTPLEGRKRMQLNIPMDPIPNSLLENVTSALVPILWIEEGVELDDVFVNRIKNDLLRTLFIVNILKWVLSIGGLIGLVATIAIHRKSKHTFAVPPVYSDQELKTPKF